MIVKKISVLFLKRVLITFIISTNILYIHTYDKKYLGNVRCLALLTII